MKKITNTVKIYKVETTKGYMMSEQGIGFSLRPWGTNTEYYEGSDNGGQDYILPEGYEVHKMTDKQEEIFFGDEHVDIVVHKSGRPQLIRADFHNMPVLEKALNQKEPER